MKKVLLATAGFIALTACSAQPPREITDQTYVPGGKYDRQEVLDVPDSPVVAIFDPSEPDRPLVSCPTTTGFSGKRVKLGHEDQLCRSDPGEPKEEANEEPQEDHKPKPKHKHKHKHKHKQKHKKDMKVPHGKKDKKHNKGKKNKNDKRISSSF